MKPLPICIAAAADINDGVEGLLSAEACVQSDKEENTWAEMDRGSYRYTKLTHPNKNISEAGCLNA